MKLDRSTNEHSCRVMNLSLEVAEAMGCAQDDRKSLKIAAMLHDVGKTAIPEEVLLKPDGLTDHEFAIIKDHPMIGQNLLSPVAVFEHERKIILHHHERWDGRGYPGGLAGESIPLLARIVSVVDSYDAMTNSRPYRQAMDVSEAIAELLENRDTQFDGKVVDCLVRLVSQRRR